jgi:hypothetical protein
MKRSTLLLPIILLCLFSCTSDEKILFEKEVTFAISSISQKETNGGRINANVDPKSVLVTVTDNSGTIVADRRELTLYKFADNFLSLPLTLKTNGTSHYHLTEFLVVDAENKITYATPKEGSALAHLVADALDIEFTISKDIITTVTPEVLAVDENVNPVDYGYGQFGFNVVKTINTVFSSFIKDTSNFALTSSHLKIEGLNDSQTDTTVLWSYETDLEAKANVVNLKKAGKYRITATKQGYKTWQEISVLTNESRVEMILEKTEEKVDVYVAGYVGARATYWKNGIPVTLNSDGSGAYATSIYVAGHDVYVAGRVWDAPFYWKNGEKIFLPVPSGGTKGATNSIIVRENEVHVCGHYITSNDVEVPAYWRNGVRTDLQVPHSFTNGVAEKMTIDGSDVYIVGYVRTWNTVQVTAALWKNGVFISLPIPANYPVSRAQGVKVSDGHVYVSGLITISPYAYATQRAVYWKDGAMQFVEETKSSYATVLDVEGSDVFIPYSVSGEGIYYWKSGEKVLVEGDNSMPSELVVSNGEVYIAGYSRSTNEEGACYWLNGKQVALPGSKNSQAISCFVVRSN